MSRVPLLDVEPDLRAQLCPEELRDARSRCLVSVVGTAFGPEEVDRISAWAPSQGCAQPEGVAYGGGHILKMRVCTEGEGCSAWKRVT